MDAIYTLVRVDFCNSLDVCNINTSSISATGCRSINHEEKLISVILGLILFKALSHIACALSIKSLLSLRYSAIPFFVKSGMRADTHPYCINVFIIIAKSTGEYKGVNRAGIIFFAAITDFSCFFTVCGLKNILSCPKLKAAEAV